jgi:hypothetical protein
LIARFYGPEKPLFDKTWALPDPGKLREERAYTLGTAAFLWGFTMNELYRVRSRNYEPANFALHRRSKGSWLLPSDASKILVTSEMRASRGRPLSPE